MKYSKFDEMQMVKFLRFRNKVPSEARKTYMTIKAIAKFLNKSEQYVWKICQKLRGKGETNPRIRKSQIDSSSFFNKYVTSTKVHFT